MIFKLSLFIVYLTYVNRLFSKEKAATANIFLSTIHAYYTVITSGFYLLDLGIFATYYHELIVFSSFFAIHDIYVQFRYDFKNKIPLTVHHLLLIFGLIMFTNYYTQDIPKKTLLAYNYLTELSTPFLNKTIMLYNQKLKHTIDYKISRAILITTFFFIRVVGGIYFIYLASYQPLILLCAQVSLTSLNFIWFYKLVEMIIKDIQNTAI